MHVDPHTGVVCCKHVLKEGALAAQVVAEHDGSFQICCWNGDHSSAAQGSWVHLHHLTDRDASINEALETLERGQTAYRSGVDQPWVFEPLPREEDAA